MFTEILRSRAFAKLLMMGIVVGASIATGVFAIAEVQEAVQQYHNTLAAVSN